MAIFVIAQPAIIFGGFILIPILIIVTTARFFKNQIVSNFGFHGSKYCSGPTSPNKLWQWRSLTDFDSSLEVPIWLHCLQGLVAKKDAKSSSAHCSIKVCKKVSGSSLFCLDWAPLINPWSFYTKILIYFFNLAFSVSLSRPHSKFEFTFHFLSDHHSFV